MARGTWIVAACGLAASIGASAAWAQGAGATRAPGAEPAPTATPVNTPVVANTPANDTVTSKPDVKPDAAPAPAQSPTGPHPATAISMRMTALRDAQRVSDAVIIVSDAKSYIDAIARWKPDRLTPVLIDDGTELSREDIARFVRAFNPKRVLRWSSPSPDAASAEGARVSSPNAASFAQVKPEDVYQALAGVFGAGEHVNDLAGLMQGWKHAEYNPPGIVITSAQDPAWVAAMALSAGRGQAIAFMNPELMPNHLNGAFEQAQFGALAVAIEHVATSMDVEWAALGDTLDAITLCANAPSRVHIQDKEYLATGDLIGRRDNSHKFARWAWPGQIAGTASQAAYRAMCALFLQPSEAWIFDGYRSEAPFDQYDGSAAAQPLRARNMVTRVDDEPNGSARQWRLRGARACNAGLIFVNTMGNSDFFDLNTGRGRPGDVPFLAVPSAMHVIHSWSLERPAARDTLGGRWLERGAFLYVGSVNEPYLGAFVPPLEITRRLSGGMIFGAAVRPDNVPPWKVVCMGDPLYSLGAPMKREGAAEEFEGATPVGQGLREAMTSADWGVAFNLLRLEGRDADAIKLLDGILAKAAKSERKALPLDAEAVRTVVPMLVRRGATPTLLTLAQQAQATSSARVALADPVVRDAIWLSAYPLLSSGVDDGLMKLMPEIIRDDQMVRDIGTVAAAQMRAKDFASAIAMLQSWRERVDPTLQKAIDEVMAQRPEQWGEQ